MEITYKNIPLINFPVYGLNSDEVYVEDCILYLKSLVLDDRNQPGESLGIRRAQSPLMLYRLNYCYTGLDSMLTNTKHNVYIDNKGYCFKYRKTRFVTIKSRRIKKVIDKGGKYILIVHSVPSPFTIARPPPAGADWVSLIYLGKQPWLPYEYSYEYCTDRRRKI